MNISDIRIKFFIVLFAGSMLALPLYAEDDIFGDDDPDRMAQRFYLERLREQQTIKGTEKSKPDSPPAKLLREGMILQGIDGNIIKMPGRYTDWFFVSDSSLSDMETTLPKGSFFELVKCSTLEQIEAEYNSKYPETAGEAVCPHSAEAAERPDPNSPAVLEPEKLVDPYSVKLWARVVRYDNKNYLYPVLFIPTTTGQRPGGAENTEEGYEGASQSPPSSDSIIPSNVMEKLKPRKFINMAKARQYVDTEGDAVLVDRTGFLVTDKGRELFHIDGFGRNISDMEFVTLPCEALKDVERSLALSQWRQRYRVSGIITKYKGDYYLLMQRAIRAYSNGNFAR